MTFLSSLGGRPLEGENRGRFTVASFILLSTTTWAETIATNLGNDGGRHPRCANWAESDVLNRPAPVRLHQNGIVHVTDIAIDGGIVPAFNRQHPVTGQAYDRELPSNRVLAAGRSAIWRNNSMASPIIACGGFRSSRKLRSVDSSSPVIARQLPTRWINVGSPSDGRRSDANVRRNSSQASASSGPPGMFWKFVRIAKAASGGVWWYR